MASMKGAEMGVKRHAGPTKECPHEPEGDAAHSDVLLMSGSLQVKRDISIPVSVKT